MKLKVIILLISLLSGSIEAQTIHYNAFSHNDYERPRPLFDALSFQFNCVEADLWLIDGELYVSHDSVAPNPDITFEKLYLLPLVERIKKNGGKVYPGSDRPFYLMVDCKTDGEAMYPVLKKKLKPYESLFCHEKDGKLQESAVLFYLSGRSPRKAIAAETNRFIFLDGTIEDLGKGIPATQMPVISDNYSAGKARERYPPKSSKRCANISGKPMRKANYSAGGVHRTHHYSKSSLSKKKWI